MSPKFISISGISSILIGIYALVGSFYVHQVLQSINTYTSLDHVFDIFTAAITVLLLSIATGIIIAKRKGVREKQPIWNSASKLMLSNICIPLLTGACITIVLLVKGYYSLIAGILLLFYGLSLVSVSDFSSNRLRWLGIINVVLGLTALWYTKNALYLLVAGFGGLHIVYGVIGLLWGRLDQRN